MMRKCKRTVCIIMCVLTALLSSLGAHAAGSYFLLEGFYYGVKGGEAYVHGYEGDDWDIVIREYFLSYPVTSIEAYAFFENDTIEALSFYDATSLQSIGDCAFARCTKLEYVNITPSINEMGRGVFEECTALTYARFRDGAPSEIPPQTFYGCETLSTVIFENEPKSIGDFAFANCTSLERIEIPDSVESISDTAFIGCDSLVIYCTKDSYALEYAVAHDIAYVITDADPEPLLLGDVDGDGTVTIIDATVILRHLASIPTFAYFEESADTDEDGDITIMDAAYIQRWLINLKSNDNIGKPIS